MKTTVDIPDKMLEEALQHSHASSHAEALLAALTEYNRRHRAADASKEAPPAESSHTAGDRKAREEPNS